MLKLNKDSRIEEEKKYLMEKPVKYEISKMTQQKVNTYSFVVVDANNYSVPDYLVGRLVNVRQSLEHIRIYSNNNLVCEHKRLEGKKQTSANIMHYLSTFHKKPGALKNSLALKQVPELKSLYDLHYSTKARDFIEILVKNKNKEIKEIIEIIRNTIKSPSQIDPMPKQDNIDKMATKLLERYTKSIRSGVLQ